MASAPAPDAGRPRTLRRVVRRLAGRLLTDRLLTDRLPARRPWAGGASADLVGALPVRRPWSLLRWWRRTARRAPGRPPGDAAATAPPGPPPVGAAPATAARRPMLSRHLPDRRGMTARSPLAGAAVTGPVLRPGHELPLRAGRPERAAVRHPGTAPHGGPAAPGRPGLDRHPRTPGLLGTVNGGRTRAGGTVPAGEVTWAAGGLSAGGLTLPVSSALSVGSLPVGARGPAVGRAGTGAAGPTGTTGPAVAGRTGAAASGMTHGAVAGTARAAVSGRNRAAAPGTARTAAPATTHTAARGLNDAASGATRTAAPGMTQAAPGMTQAAPSMTQVASGMARAAMAGVARVAAARPRLALNSAAPASRPAPGPDVHNPQPAAHLRVLGAATLPPGSEPDPTGAVVLGPAAAPRPRPRTRPGLNGGHGAPPVPVAVSPRARWEAAVAARPLESPRPLPTALHAMASAITGRSRPPLFTTGPATRHALAAAGALGATTGTVVHLPAAPTPGPSVSAVLAHELTHTRSPVRRPRFFLGGASALLDDDERSALAAGGPLGQARAAAGAAGAGIVDRLPVGGGLGAVGDVATRAARAAVLEATAGPLAGDVRDVAAGVTDPVAGAVSGASGLVQQAVDPAARAAETVSGAAAAGAAGVGAAGVGGAAGAAKAALDPDKVVEIVEQRLLREIERRGGRWAGMF